MGRHGSIFSKDPFSLKIHFLQRPIRKLTKRDTFYETTRIGLQFPCSRNLICWRTPWYGMLVPYVAVRNTSVHAALRNPPHPTKKFIKPYSRNLYHPTPSPFHPLALLCQPNSPSPVRHKQAFGSALSSPATPTLTPTNDQSQTPF